MAVRKTYITPKFVCVLFLTLFLMFLPFSEAYNSILSLFVEHKLVMAILSAIVSFSGVLLFLWLAPKTSMEIDDD